MSDIALAGDAPQLNGERVYPVFFRRLIPKVCRLFYNKVIFAVRSFFICKNTKSKN
jgi:hypothetical protein